MSRYRWGAAVAGAVLGVLVIAGNLAGSFRGVERPGLVLPEPLWAERLQRVERALAEQNRSTAIYEWREALGAALHTRRWKPMAEVADAALKIDALQPIPGHFRAEARRVYLNALFRARAERSLEGVQRVGEAFERLGDAEAAEQARRVAAELS